MDIIQILALTFMAYEIIKLGFSSVLWNQARVGMFNIQNEKQGKAKEKETKTSLLTKYLGIIYLIFTVYLIFTPFKIVGIGILILSIAGVIALYPSIKKDEPFSAKIFAIQLVDTILTLMLLTNIINPLTLFN